MAGARQRLRDNAGAVQRSLLTLTEHLRSRKLERDRLAEVGAAVLAVLRTAVEVDLRARAGRAGLPGRPVVVVLAESLDEALALKARHPDWVALKDGPLAPGFDAVNSPGLLRSIDLGGRTVVQKTTAGTVGALAVKEAPLVLCAGFVVAEATARLLRTRKSDSVTFVVTGEDGQADEDLACAQYIARRATGAGTDAAEFLRRAAASRRRCARR